MPEDSSGTDEKIIDEAYADAVRAAFQSLLACLKQPGSSVVACKNTFKDALKKAKEAREEAKKIAEELEPKKAGAK